MDGSAKPFVNLLLKAKIKDHSIKEIATELIKLSREGLKNRSCLDLKGNDETQYLKVLEEIVRLEKTPAEQLLDSYNSVWNKKVNNLIKDMSY